MSEVTQSPSLKPSEREALEIYKDFSDDLNNALRSENSLSLIQSELAGALDAVLSRCALRRPLVVYRATCWPYSLLSPGDTFQYPAFLSTSIHDGLVGAHYPAAAQCPHAARLRIECPTGAWAAELSTLLGRQDDEGEVLLPRNTTFQVRSIRRLIKSDEIASAVGALPWRKYESFSDVDLVYLL